ncbi:MAG: stage II sporulation protein M [Alteromonadaceae bacterium]|nr:stage II sporulation protein M [Alteromonadaceae bacterium]
MKQNQFVHMNSERWQHFENNCADFEHSLPVDFAKNYRQICNDLSIARTRHYSPSLIDKLNNFVRLGQSRLYQGEGLRLRTLLNLFRQTFIQSLHDNRFYLLAALISFWGLALISYVWVILEPNAVYLFLDLESVKNIATMYDPAGSVQSESRGVDSDVLMFGVYIYNNIGIAFQMFGGGALFCVGAIIPLLFNSFYFGAVAAHIVNLGYQAPFFSFVITHGSFELTAIIIAGAAGCKIGYSLLNPGQYSRGYAIKQAGKSVLPLIVGAFIMLVIAAVIEAFWSGLDIPPFFKYVTGAICWFYVLSVLYKGMRYGHN